jgi:hypothetical protein
MVLLSSYQLTPIINLYDAKFVNYSGLCKSFFEMLF